MADEHQTPDSGQGEEDTPKEQSAKSTDHNGSQNEAIDNLLNEPESQRGTAPIDDQSTPVAPAPGNIYNTPQSETDGEPGEQPNDAQENTNDLHTNWWFEAADMLVPFVGIFPMCYAEKFEEGKIEYTKGHEGSIVMGDSVDETYGIKHELMAGASFEWLVGGAHKLGLSYEHETILSTSEVKWKEVNLVEDHKWGVGKTITNALTFGLYGLYTSVTSGDSQHKAANGTNTVANSTVKIASLEQEVADLKNQLATVKEEAVKESKKYVDSEVETVSKNVKTQIDNSTSEIRDVKTSVDKLTADISSIQTEVAKIGSDGALTVL